MFIFISSTVTSASNWVQIPGKQNQIMIIACQIKKASTMTVLSTKLSLVMVDNTTSYLHYMYSLTTQLLTTQDGKLLTED
uniref:Uncharacterized protein n=1 Tax=Arion vulgaris TaxID=1028688 RepID=A0A0B6YAI5_9EUPU